MVLTWLKSLYADVRAAQRGREPPPPPAPSPARTLAEAIAQAESLGQLARQGPRIRTEAAIAAFEAAYGQPPPELLGALYEARIASVGGEIAVYPQFSDRHGSELDSFQKRVNPNYVPIFHNGCGDDYALKLTGPGALSVVFWFDHENPESWEEGDHEPASVAASTLSRFILLMAQRELQIAYDEDDERWVADDDIDPDLAALRAQWGG